jgi:hypothetical protein
MTDEERIELEHLESRQFKPDGHGNAVSYEDRAYLDRLFFLRLRKAGVATKAEVLDMYRTYVDENLKEDFVMPKWLNKKLNKGDE